MSQAERDARIAEIEGRVTAWCVASGVNHAEFMRNLAVTVLDEFPTGSTAGDRMNKIGVLAGIDAPWLIAELRAALSREEEAKKDAERAFLAGASFVAGEDSHGASVFEAAAKYAEEHGTDEEVAGLRRMLAEWKRDFVALAADRRL